jgi:hypothetical protein
VTDARVVSQGVNSIARAAACCAASNRRKWLGESTEPTKVLAIETWSGTCSAA